MMSDRKVVAVVGSGIGRSHIAEGYAQLPDQFEVRVLCDLNAERMQKVADEFAIPERISEFADLLGRQDIDIIDVCTPPGAHLPMITAALQVGKQVVCEKPLVGSLAQVDQLAALQAKSAGSVMPIFQYRWGEGFRQARHLVRSGLAGTPYMATAETAWKRGADYYAMPWRGKFSTELGGVLVSHAIHLHDMVCELMGGVRSVTARLATRVNPIEVEDCAAVVLEMESGALVTLSATLGSAVEISRLRACFSNLTVESGLAPYNPGAAGWTFSPMQADFAAKIDVALAEVKPSLPRFGGQMAEYHSALVSGAPLPVTLDDARRSLELVTAIYHSADIGQTVAVPIGATHPKYHSWAPAHIQAA